MAFSSYQRRVTGNGFAATPVGKLDDVDLPQGTTISFEVNPSLCRRRDKVVFEWLGMSFQAPVWLVHDKTEPVS